MFHQIRHRFAAWFTVTLFVIPCVAEAQRIASTLDAQAIQLRYADSLNASATGLAPTLRLDWDNLMLRASGTYAQFAHAWSADGSVDASVFTPAVHALSGEIGGTLGGSTHQDRTRTGTAIGMARLHLDDANVGAWVGAGGGVTSDGYVWRRVRQAEAGAWLWTGPATLTLIAQPTLVSDSIRYTDVTAEGSWRGGIVQFRAIAGTRAGARLPYNASSATTWGSLSAVAWVLPRIALLASAGTYPIDYTQNFPGGRFVSAGVRLSLTGRSRPELSRVRLEPEVAASGVSTLQLVRAADGKRTLRVRVPGANIVEVNGDFTGWQPRALIQEGDGWYELSAPIAPGTYQMNIRMNGGAWAPPPSIPTVRDEFGGLTGVLVVP